VFSDRNFYLLSITTTTLFTAAADRGGGVGCWCNVTDTGFWKAQYKVNGCACWKFSNVKKRQLYRYWKLGIEHWNNWVASWNETYAYTKRPTYKLKRDLHIWKQTYIYEKWFGNELQMCTFRCRLSSKLTFENFCLCLLLRQGQMQQ